MKILRFIPLAFLVCNLFPIDQESVCLLESPSMNHHIEVSIQKPVGNEFQLLVFLHGASGNGLESISQSWCDFWLAKGYAIAAISLPGYGGSTGEKDFCGPFTLNALHFAINWIKQEINVPDFGLIGFGQGGFAGVLLSTQRTDMKCVVCANSGYDLLKTQSCRRWSYEYSAKKGICYRYK